MAPAIIHFLVRLVGYFLPEIQAGIAFFKGQRPLHHKGHAAGPDRKLYRDFFAGIF